MIKNILLLIIVMICGANSLHSQSKFGFFTIKYDTKDLCFVDTLGNVDVIGATGLPSTMLPYHSLDFDKNGNLWCLFGDNLYLINTKTGKAQATKLISNRHDTSLGLSFNSHNELYFHQEVSNVAAGTIAKIENFVDGIAMDLPNSTGLPSMFGIEFDDDDKLYTIDEFGTEKLHQINTTTGLPITNSFDSYRLGGDPADLDFSKQTLFGISYSSPTNLFKIKRGTGEFELLCQMEGLYFGLAGAEVNSCTITDTTYISITDTLLINTVATDLNNEEISLLTKVYPNPAKSHLYITNKGYHHLSEHRINIYNGIGQLVFSELFTQEQFYIDLSTWDGKGLYVLNIVDSGGKIINRKKIIIQ